MQPSDSRPPTVSECCRRQTASPRRTSWLSAQCTTTGYRRSRRPLYTMYTKNWQRSASATAGPARNERRGTRVRKSKMKSVVLGRRG
eukprot:8219332-Pyramimonas_sp.AAC.1